MTAVAPRPTAAPTSGPASATVARGWVFWAVLVAIAVAALGMRLYKLDAPSFWEDEIFTVKWSKWVAKGGFENRPLAYLANVAGLAAAGVDVPNLSWTSPETWQAAGVSEWNVRIPSPIIACVTILALGAASRLIMRPRAALILAGLITFSTWHLWMSQVGRFYVQQFLFYNLALVVYYAAAEQRGPRAWIGLALAALLSLAATLTQLTSMLIAAIFVADYLVTLALRRPAFGLHARYAAVIAGIGTIGLALVIWRLYQTYNPANFTGSPQPPKVFVLGYVLMIGVPVVVAAGAGAWMLWRTRPRLAVYLLISGIVPVLLFLVLGQVGYDVHVRYTFVALFASLALGAIALDDLVEAVEPRLGRLVAWAPVAIVFAGLLFNAYVYYGPAHGYRARWREAFAYVQAQRHPGQAVAGDYVARLLARYYLTESEIAEIPTQPKAADLTKLTEPTWIVFRATEPAAGVRSGVLDRHADLRAYFNLQNVQPFHAVHVYFYDPAKPPAAEPAKAPAADGR